jgi:hypothetical protein
MLCRVRRQASRIGQKGISDLGQGRRQGLRRVATTWLKSVPREIIGFLGMSPEVLRGTNEHYHRDHSEGAAAAKPAKKPAYFQG